MTFTLHQGENNTLFPLDESFGILGILNVSPDSFYNNAVGKINEEAARLLAGGADILDLGAESTRPGAKPIPASIEIERLAPAIRQLRMDFPDARISVDTWKAETAVFAIAEGACLINDVSGLLDPALPGVLAEFKPGYCLTYSYGPRGGKSADKDDIISDAKRFFEVRLKLLTAAGLPEDRVMLDPGIGFGKSRSDNLALLSRIGEFREFGRPLLAAISMKSFFGDLLGLGSRGRGEVSAVASALLWEKGVFWHRAHDPSRIRDALRLAAALTRDCGQGKARQV